MISKRTIVALAILAAVTVPGTALAQTEVPKQLNLETLSVEMLDKFALDNHINLGDARSKDAKIAVIKDAMGKQYDMATLTKLVADPFIATQGTVTKKPVTADSNLPPAELLTPIIPNMGPDTAPGRALNIGRLIVGFFAFCVLLYGGFRFIALALKALAGKLTMKGFIEEAMLYGVAYAVLFLVLKGAAYGFLKEVYEFLIQSAS